MHYQLQDYLDETGGTDLPARAELKPVTHFSYRFSQRWLQPLIDFSLPPEQVYTNVIAWELIEAPDQILQQLNSESLQDAVVIIAAGGYYAAGIERDGDDNFPLPPAVNYWHRQTGKDSSHLTGGEAHAYMTHHLLSNRLVVPIPDLWMVLAAAVVGKALAIYLADRPKQSAIPFATALAAGTAAYGVFSLQLYVSGAIMLPWLLPSVTIWLFVLPVLLENYHEQA